MNASTDKQSHYSIEIEGHLLIGQGASFAVAEHERLTALKAKRDANGVMAVARFFVAASKLEV